MDNPGITLEKKLKTANMARKELAQRTGVTEKHISTVINGERGISASFARKLGYVFENAQYWLELQAQYDAEQMKIQEENEIGDDELKILKPLHEIVAYFIELGFMHNGCGEASKVMQLRSLLNISNLTLIPKVTYNAAYRAQLSTNIRVDPYVLFAWQKLCEKVTENVRVSAALSTTLLKEKLPEIKEQMFGNINEGIHKLQNIFSQCGIAFQVVRNFRGAPVQGFIKQVPGDRMILCLTIRGKRADTFWFTLFHEIAHILHGDYSSRFVDFDSVEGSMEKKADVFAGDQLIDPTLYRKFIRTPECMTWSGIERFADKIHVQPFIILGRLQNDRILDWTQFSGHVVRYEWAG